MRFRHEPQWTATTEGLLPDLLSHKRVTGGFDYRVSYWELVGPVSMPGMSARLEAPSFPLALNT